MKRGCLLVLALGACLFGCGGSGGTGAVPAGPTAWRIVGMNGSRTAPELGAYTGVLQPDGAGSYTLLADTNESGVISTGVSLSNVDFHVTPSGDAHMGIGGAGVIGEGVRSADGQLVALTRLAAGGDPGLDFLVPRVAGATLGSMSGTWRYVAYAFDPSGPDNTSALGFLTFDGAGAFTGTSTSNEDGALSSSTTGGTYSVTADGTLELNFFGLIVMRGGVSPSGEVAIVAGSVGGSSSFPALFVLVRPAGGTSASDLSGVYSRIAFDNRYASSEYVSGIGVFGADGGGNYMLSNVRQNTEGLIAASSGLNGTYTLGVDGTLIIKLPGLDPLYTGSLSTGGDIAISAGGLQSGLPGHLEVVIRR